MSLKQQLARQAAAKASITASDGEGGPPPEVQEKIDEKKEDKGEDTPKAEEEDGESEGAVDDVDNSMDDDFDLDGFDLTDLTDIGDIDDGADDMLEPIPDGEEVESTMSSETGDDADGELPPGEDEDEAGDIDPISAEAEDDEEAPAEESDAPPFEEVPEDEEDQSEAEWFHAQVAAGLVDCVLWDKAIDSRKAAASALREKGYARGASFVRAMDDKSFARMQRMLVPVYQEVDRVMADHKANETKAKKVVASLQKAGSRRKAAILRRELREARIKDIAEADLDCPSSPWLERSIAAFRAAPVTPAKPRVPRRAPVKPARRSRAASVVATAGASANVREFNPKAAVAQGYLAIARSCSELASEGQHKIAAKMFLGSTGPDAVQAVTLLHDLVQDNQNKKAVAVVRDLIKATTDRTMNPAVMDPAVPVPGSGNRGPMPDAGFSFGMEDTEVRKAMGLLGVGEEPEYMRWVATLPRTASGELDDKGPVELYSDEPGGETQEMPFVEAAKYIANRMKRRAVLLSDPNDVGEVQASDVHMILHASASEDPFYTVIVKGAPLGEIHLADQSNQAQIRDVFVDDRLYGTGVRDAMRSMGCAQTLEAVSYRPFLAAYSRTAEVERIRAQAAELADQDVERRVAEHNNEVISLMLLANEGIRRNIYPIDDPLKYALFNRMKDAGIREASIPSIIEEALNMPLAPSDAQAGEGHKVALAYYLEILASKAEELRAMSPETLQAVSTQILGAPVRLRDPSHVVASSGQSLKERLASGSQFFTATPTESANPVTESSTETLRRALNIGRKG